MNRIATSKRPTTRAGLAAFAIAMLISLAAISTPVQAQAVPRYECNFCEKALAATSTPVQAQEIRSFPAFPGFLGGVSVGVAAGQTVRVVFRTSDDAGPVLDPSGKPDVI